MNNLEMQSVKEFAQIKDLLNLKLSEDDLAKLLKPIPLEELNLTAIKSLKYFIVENIELFQGINNPDLILNVVLNLSKMHENFNIHFTPPILSRQHLIENESIYPRINEFFKELDEFNRFSDYRRLDSPSKLVLIWYEYTDATVAKVFTNIIVYHYLTLLIKGLVFLNATLPNINFSDANNFIKPAILLHDPFNGSTTRKIILVAQLSVFHRFMLHITRSNLKNLLSIPMHEMLDANSNMQAIELMLQYFGHLIVSQES